MLFYFEKFDLKSLDSFTTAKFELYTLFREVLTKNNVKV